MTDAADVIALELGGDVLTSEFVDVALDTLTAPQGEPT